MLVETLRTLFERDLEKLKSEIALYKNESTIWVIEEAIANSAGNLCLHLVGNLNTYIGVRHRELEFSLKNIPRVELINKVEETIGVLNNTLGRLTDEEIKHEYPALVFEKKTSTEYFLIHLAMHLSYHLGQINYHRRLLDA